MDHLQVRSGLPKCAKESQPSTPKSRPWTDGNRTGKLVSSSSKQRFTKVCVQITSRCERQYSPYWDPKPTILLGNLLLFLRSSGPKSTQIHPSHRIHQTGPNRTGRLKISWDTFCNCRIFTCNCKEPSVFAFLHRYDERGEGTSLRSEVKKLTVTSHQLRRNS
jgi:hypothetical protein